jgi:hypothetical protein
MCGVVIVCLLFLTTIQQYKFFAILATCYGVWVPPESDVADGDPDSGAISLLDATISLVVATTSLKGLCCSGVVDAVVVD